MRIATYLFITLLVTGCAQDPADTFISERFFNYDGYGVTSLQVDDEVVFILLSKEHSIYNSKVLNREEDEFALSVEITDSNGANKAPIHVYGSIGDGVKTIVVDNNPADPELGNYLILEKGSLKSLDASQTEHWKALCFEKI